MFSHSGRIFSLAPGIFSGSFLARVELVLLLHPSLASGFPWRFLGRVGSFPCPIPCRGFHQSLAYLPFQCWVSGKFALIFCNIPEEMQHILHKAHQ